tara:strand:- start:1664 stop:2392 length:729 start_codon:yes stop_codon:yes gene_type:complete
MQDGSPQVSFDEFDTFIRKNANVTPFPQTEFQCTNFVAGSHATKYRAVRQALLEVATRNHGINKMHIEIQRVDIDIDERVYKLDKLGFKEGDIPGKNDFEARLLYLELTDKRIDRGEYVKRLTQSEMELRYFLDWIKEQCDDDEQKVASYMVLDKEEEHKYWVARMAKQSAVDLIGYGTINVGNIDSILMMPEEDQSKALDMALKYAGCIKSGMERMKLKAEEDVSFLDEGMPSRKMISDAQ